MREEGEEQSELIKIHRMETGWFRSQQSESASAPPVVVALLELDAKCRFPVNTADASEIDHIAARSSVALSENAI